MEELKALWEQKRGTGTYEAAAKEYLVEKGYTLKSSYGTSYSTEPKNWDALGTSYASDTNFIVQTCDGLLEYDIENVQQPALAESYEVSGDGLVYTFHIREGFRRP